MNTAGEPFALHDDPCLNWVPVITSVTETARSWAAVRRRPTCHPYAPAPAPASKSTPINDATTPGAPAPRP